MIFFSSSVISFKNGLTYFDTLSYYNSIFSATSLKELKDDDKSSILINFYIPPIFSNIAHNFS